MSQSTSADESWLYPMTQLTGQQLGHGDITLHLHHHSDTSLPHPIWAGRPLRQTFGGFSLKIQSRDPELTLSACEFSASAAQKYNLTLNHSLSVAQLPSRAESRNMEDFISKCCLYFFFFKVTPYCTAMDSRNFFLCSLYKQLFKILKNNSKIVTTDFYSFEIPKCLQWKIINLDSKRKQRWDQGRVVDAPRSGLQQQRPV